MLTLLVSIMVPSTGALADPGPRILMALCLDGSGSISTDDWTLMKNGLYAAFDDPDVVPQDGSVEVCIIQFADNIGGWARVELEPTIHNVANEAFILGKIAGMVQAFEFTPLAAGIDLCVATLMGSAYWGTAEWRIINITTDGLPNRGDPNGETAAEIAVAAAMAAGIDEIDIEAVGGFSVASIQWMADDICVPDGPNPPGSISGAIIPDEPYPPRDPYPARGFVIKVATFADYPEAIAEKFQQIIPQPSLELTPRTASNYIDTNHCVTATFMRDSDPVEDVDVTFTVIAGPHMGATGIVTTDANGEATWCYPGTLVGQDTIEATCYDEVTQVDVTSNTVTKDWEEPYIPPQVPSMTQWGIMATVIVLAALTPLVLRRRLLSGV